MAGAQAELKRELGLGDAVAVGLGAVVGAGIFVVIGQAAAIAGWELLAALLIAGALAACNALSTAALAAWRPTSGGVYEYAHELIHPAAGFAAGWLFVCSKLMAAATAAIGFGSALALLVPSVDSRAASVLAIGALTLANLAGIRRAGQLNMAILVVSVGSLLVFAGWAAPYIRLPAPQEISLSWVSILQAAGIIFFSYTGYARIATLAEEVKSPETTIPRAVLITIASAVLLYLLVAVAALGVAGPGGLASSPSPLLDAARSLGGNPAALIISAGLTAAALGVLLSQALGISRVLLAMGRRGDLPSWTARVDSRTGVPAAAVWTTGAAACLLAWFGGLDWVVSGATFSILLYYAAANICALRLKTERSAAPPWVSWCGLAGCVGLVPFAKLESAAAVAGILAAGFLLRCLVRRQSPSPAPPNPA